MKKMLLVMLMAALLCSTAAYAESAETAEQEETAAQEETSAQEETAEQEEMVIPEGTIVPQPREVDPEAPEDGIYPVEFAKENLMNIGDGLTLVDVEIFTEDTYDIVDISTLEEGSTILIDGQLVTVETLEKDGDVLINGGGEEGGYLLRPMEESNCYVVVLLDDLTTYTSHGRGTIVLNPDCVFHDSWDLNAEPVEAAGIDAIMKAFEETEMDTFVEYNTTIRVENGEIAEITRTYMP